MRDLTWKFFHRWWQPKLHHIILEAEAKGSGPVHLSAEEWAAASARATRRESRRRHRATIRRRLLGGIFGLGGSTVHQGADGGDASGEGRGYLAHSGNDETSNRIGLHDRGWGTSAAIAGGGMSDSNAIVGRSGGGGSGDGGLVEKGGLGFSADADLAEAGRVVQQPRGRVEEEGLGLSLEDIQDVRLEVGGDGVRPGLFAGAGSAGGAGGGGAGGDGRGDDGTTEEIHRNNTDIMSRPSSFGTAGEDVVGVLGYSTPRAVSRSCSWVSMSCFSL